MTAGKHVVVRTLLRIVEFSRRTAAIFVPATLIATVALAAYVAYAIDVDTNTDELLSRSLPFRQQNIAFQRVFPGLHTPIVVVLDGADADAVESAGNRLSARMRRLPGVFPTVLDPASDPFFRRSGLLYLSVGQLADLSDRLAENQPFLATLAGDPSLRGLLDMLRRAIDEGADELARAGGLSAGLDALAEAIERQARGERAAVAWGALMGGDALPQSRRRVVVAESSLDSGSLEPAARTFETLQGLADELGFAAAGVRMRLTGEPALNTEELESVFAGMVTASLLSLCAVSVIVFLGLRSLRLVLAVLATLVIGLVWTAAFAVLAVGALNLISVAFAVLFVGIAVDFGIHFALRYKEQLLRQVPHQAALANATIGVGPSLLLAALAALIAFFSFLPTAYRGVAELGLISGIGMLIAAATSFTVLPAILTVLPKGRAIGPGAVPKAMAVEGFVRARARTICIAALAIFLAALPLAARVHFEKNPLNLQDPANPSVQTLRELMREDPAARPTISVVTRSLADAQALARRLEGLPSVDSTMTAASLMPDDVERKLEIIGDMNVFLAPLAIPAPPAAAPSDAERRQAIGGFIAVARPFAASAQAGALGAPLRRLADALQRFRDGPGRAPEALTMLEQGLLGGLPARLEALREALGARAVALDDIPPALLRQYLAPDGHALVEVRPRFDLSDNDALRRFHAEVTGVAPDAVGSVVLLVASGDAVVAAFREASLIALVLITLLLYAQLRSIQEVALVLAPLVLAATLTFAISAAIGPPINFANIIVVPLLLGLGVSSGIYLVTRAREEHGGLLLRTITPRAVLFSALTTIASFGSLAVERHVGTASMGELLLIALSLSLACTLIVLPALLALRHDRRLRRRSAAAGASARIKAGD